MAGMQVGLYDRIEQTMTGIVDPHIHTLKVMQREAEDAVDFFGVADVAAQCHGSVRESNSTPRRFRSRLIARQHDNVCAFGCKLFRDRLADTHRGAGDYDYRSVEFHVRVVFSARRQVKMTNLCRTIRSNLLCALEIDWLFFLCSRLKWCCFPELLCL